MFRGSLKALLVIVVITDEANPEGRPIDWYNDLVEVKGGDGFVVFLGLTGVATSTCGAGNHKAVNGLAELFGRRGSVGDVCAPSYGPFFAGAVDIIDDACDSLPEG